MNERSSRILAYLAGISLPKMVVCVTITPLQLQFFARSSTQCHGFAMVAAVGARRISAVSIREERGG